MKGKVEQDDVESNAGFEIGTALQVTVQFVFYSTSNEKSPKAISRGDFMKNYCGFYVIMDCKGARGGKKETSLEIASKGESMVSWIMVIAMELERHGYILKTESS